MSITMTTLTPVFSTRTGQRMPVAVGFELAELRPARNIRRPRAARHPWRVTCTPTELQAADAKRV